MATIWALSRIMSRSRIEQDDLANRLTQGEYSMTNQSEPQVSRRGFLKVITVTGAAAVAAGAGAALLKQNPNTPATITTVSSAPLAVSTPITAATPQNEVLARLAAVQAENMRLQAALDAANRQLETYQLQNQDTSAATESLNVQLGEANAQIGILAGLVALYEQLEEVDVETVVENGLTAVSDTLANLLDDIPTLEEGIQAGHVALAEVENNIPLLENGRIWLENHTGKLDTYFQSIENMLQDAVESAGPFLQMLNDWFEGVRKWLPFGLGQKAAAVMQSITTLLIETPATISGLDTNISQPLAAWLNRDNDGEILLRKNVIKPLRENVLTKTEQTVGKAKETHLVYTAQLKEPVQTAVTNQRAIRQMITLYREEHQV
ncbi:MAG TPA: twin-arginine translocation signal domain-containing protein [Anaerolineae bacterium]|nr:twin-arginine translocation signal domain-containing protein [Anaerolineae bacterium]